MFRVPSPSFHRDIYSDYVDSAIRRMCYVAPRGHAKTSTFKILLLHHILFGGPNRLILVISRTQGHAIRICNAIKNILTYNKLIKAVFGDWGQRTARKWSDTETVLYNGTLLHPGGSGQQVRGIFSDDFRPTLLLMDDLQDKENVRTRESMDALLDWFLSEACQTIDPQIGRIFTIGTLIAHGCIVDRLKDTRGWQSRWWKAVPDLNGVEWDGDPNNVMPTLWPEWWPWDRLMEEMMMMQDAGNGSLFWREFQNDIKVKSESLADPSNWKKIIDYNIEHVPNQVYKLLGVTYADKTVETKIPVFIFGGADPAAGTSDSADFSVLFDLARSVDRDFAFDMLRSKMKTTAFGDYIISRNRKLKYNGVNIETVAYQQMLRQYIKDSGEQIIGIDRENQPRHRKDERLRSLEGPLNKSGFTVNTTKMGAFIDEVQRFPLGRHDDTLDGCWYAYKNSYPCLEKAFEAVKTVPGRRAARMGINWLTGLPYRDE